MKYLCLIYVDDQRLARLSDVEYRRLMDECFANDEYQRRAGRVLASEALETVETATTLRHEPAGLSIIDGPFAETKELLAGFWIWQVRSFDEAVEWLKRAPFDEGTEIELRPIFEMEDFGAAITPELREQEERVRAESAKLAG